MGDALAMRRAGKRRAERRKTPIDMVGPSIGLSSSGRPGEFRLNSAQAASLEQLYVSHPAIAAARGILHGQLLKGGLSVRRDGAVVDLQPAFAAHLDEVWLPFAADVVDSFLKWGLCAVVYEEDDESLQAQLAKRQRVADGKGLAASNLVPMVPPRESYDLAFVQGGRAGYKRTYRLYNASPTHAAQVDEDARIFVREHPDAGGNLVSPMSKIFDLGTFVTALTELALTAELTLARPRLWTQARLKKDGNGLEPGALFFDSASREVQASQDAQDNRSRVDALAMQQQMCKLINELQTRHAPQQQHQGRGSFTGQSAGKQSSVPPEIPPAIFALPADQEIAPSAGQLPQARGDLEALQRLAIELFSSAFGVPADLLFGGRFASKTTAQYASRLVPSFLSNTLLPPKRPSAARRLSLLNTTVAQLATSVNKVLTACYREVYGAGDGGEAPPSLVLLTSPLAATEEVSALYAAGLVPLDIAVPSVLNAIGATRDEIDSALEEMKAKEQEKNAGEDEERTLANQEKRDGLDAGKLRLEVEIDAVKASTEKTRAEAANVGKERSVAGSGGA